MARPYRSVILKSTNQLRSTKELANRRIMRTWGKWSPTRSLVNLGSVAARILLTKKTLGSDLLCWRVRWLSIKIKSMIASKKLGTACFLTLMYLPAQPPEAPHLSSPKGRVLRAQRPSVLSTKALSTCMPNMASLSKVRRNIRLIWRMSKNLKPSVTIRRYLTGKSRHSEMKKKLFCATRMLHVSGSLRSIQWNTCQEWSTTRACHLPLRRSRFTRSLRSGRRQVLVPTTRRNLSES